MYHHRNIRTSSRGTQCPEPNLGHMVRPTASAQQMPPEVHHRLCTRDAAEPRMTLPGTCTVRSNPEVGCWMLTLSWNKGSRSRKGAPYPWGHRSQICRLRLGSEGRAFPYKHGWAVDGRSGQPETRTGTAEHGICPGAGQLNVLQASALNTRVEAGVLRLRRVFSRRLGFSGRRTSAVQPTCGDPRESQSRELGDLVLRWLVQMQTLLLWGVLG